MPLDYNDTDEIVLAKDLKPGDCVRSRSWSDEEDGNSMGIIVATTFYLDEEGKKLKKFYGKKEGAVSQYDINCPSDGPYSGPAKPNKEFKVIKSRKDILYTYEKISYQLMSRSADLMQQRNELMDIRDDAVERMNNRLTKIKKRKLTNVKSDI